ncbi:MAG: TonB-dependent receptor [Helicobacteraceae bacterium]|nr:TonB-dependent receptor [Helicobacteraceae bacterium]
MPIVADDESTESNGAPAAVTQSSQTTTAPTRAKSDDDVTELDEIKVVSAAGYEQNIADAPASVFVIAREELEKKSFNDLTDVLKNVPGIYITGGSVYKDISIRGMTSGYTLYLIDGKPMQGNDANSPNATGGGVAVGALPPVSMIERIEVVRGPMSSLYGSEAIGGVINIITKKVPSEWSGSFKSEYTKTLSDVTQDGYSGNLNIAGPIVQDLLSLQAYGSVLGVDEQHCPEELLALGTNNACGDKAAAPAARYDNRQVGAKAIWAINKANSAWAAYDYSRQERAATAGVSNTAWGAGRSGSMSVKQTASAGHDLKLDDFALNTYIQKAATENPRGDGIFYEVLTLNTQGTYYFDTNILTVGAQYRNEMLDDIGSNVLSAEYNVTGNNTWKYKSMEIDRDQYAIFAEDEWNILDNLALTGGVRLNHDEDYGAHITPRLYAVYHPIDEVVVKGGVSGGYKTPSIRQISNDFGSVSGGGAYPPNVTIGNADLDPESSISYEASVAYDNKAIGFGASLTAYHTDFKDKIESYAVCNGGGNNAALRSDGIPFCTQGSKDYYEAYYGSSFSDPVLDLNGGPYSSGSTYHNVEGAELEGIEVTLNYNLPSIVSVAATYTHTDSEQKTGTNKGKALNAISKHMYNVNVDFDVTARFALWAQYNYRGKYLETTATSPATNKSYDFVDMGTVIRLKDGVKLLAGVYNVANKEVTSATHGKTLEGRRLTVGVNADF